MQPVISTSQPVNRVEDPAGTENPRFLEFSSQLSHEDGDAPAILTDMCAFTQKSQERLPSPGAAQYALLTVGQTGLQLLCHRSQWAGPVPSPETPLALPCHLHFPPG